MPQISVPITQLSGNEMAMPISLSYHASGNKVNQMASWVGLGWSLQAGGVITREVRDQPDDAYRFSPSVYHCMFPCLNCDDCSSTPVPPSISSVCDNCNKYKKLEYNYTDMGYLYTKLQVFFLHGKNPTDFTNNERLFLFGRSDERKVVSDNTYNITPEYQNNWFLLEDQRVFLEAGLPVPGKLLSHTTLDAYDTEADIFNFNFNGYSGQFIFNKDGFAKIITNDDLIITYTLSQTQNIMSEYSAIGMTSAFEGGITEFKITTPDGATYIFNEKEITHSDSEGQDNGSSSFGSYHDCDPQLNRPYQTPLLKRRAAYTAWYLSKVYNPKGQVAFDLEYEKEVTIDHSNISQSKSEGVSSQPYSKSSSVVTTFGKRLKKIKAYTIVEGTNSLTESVEFEPTSAERPDLHYPTWLTDKMSTTFSKSKALGKIIQKGTDETVTLKEFAFNYGSFQKALDNVCSVSSIPDYVNKHAERLKLLSVTETGKFGGTALVEPFSFEYDETPLPPRHSPHQDFWGYYNGPTKTQSLLPKLYAFPNYTYGSATYANFQTIYSIFLRPNFGGLNTDYFILNQPTGFNLANDRTPVFANAKAGILKKINYPTGGNVSFDYEEHKYSMDNFMNLDQYSAGGLRIKSVTNSAGVTNSYKYTKTIGTSVTEYSTGKLVQLPNFGQSKFSEAGGVTTEEKIKNSTTISSSSNFNTNNGNFHVGYEQVTETETNNGKTIYYYNTPAILGVTQHSENNTVLFKYPDVWRNQEGLYSDLNPFAPVPNYDWNRGLLLKKEVYTEGGTTPLQTTTNTYKLVKFEKIPSIKVETINTSPGTVWDPLNSADFQALAKYYTLVADKRLETVTIKENYGANFVETITTYGYGNYHKNPISSTITNSNAKVYKTEIVYSKDLPSSTDPAIIKLKEYNIITPIETKLLIDNTLQAGVKNEFFNYTVGSKTMPLQKKWIEILKNSAIDEKAEVESYNSDGRVTKWKQSNFTTSEELKYGTTTGLLEEKKFATLISKVTYHPNIRAIKTLTTENGQTTSFSYDPLLRLQTMQSKFDNPDPTVLSNPKVTTTNSYNFGGISAPNNNYVGTSITFSDYTSTQTMKQYFDGLGRPISSIRENYTPNYSHQKNNITYDAIGRQDRAYQPFESSSTGYEAIASTVPRSDKPYMNTVYEASPLSRPAKKYMEDGNYIEMQYGTNNADYPVRQFDITAGTGGNFYTIAPTASYNGFYPDNSLYRVTTWDENANTAEPKKGRIDIFKDKVGRTILTRKFVKGAGGAYKDVDTYNIYDDYSNLIAVIPPDVLTSTGSISAYTLIFQYKYDIQNRLSSKWIPGADAQELYYDNRDLVVLVQDGKQRVENKLLATIYDPLGRPIKTGFVPISTVGTTRTAVESYINTNNGVPATAISATDVLMETSYMPNKSLVAQTKARVLGNKLSTDADFVVTNYEYDTYGRLNGTTSNSHTNQYTSMYFPQNDADKPYSNFHSWVGPDNQYKVTLQYNYYDNGLRPTNTYHSIVLDNTWSNITYQRLVSNLKYDYKDRLIEKNLAGKFDWNTWSMKYVQSIDYEYNNRGWLTKMNKGYLPEANWYDVFYPVISCAEPFNWYFAGSPSFANPNLHEGDNNPDLFAMELRYDNPNSAFPGSISAQKNGNIAQMQWQVAGRAMQGYSFAYDELDRLLEGNYTDINNPSNWIGLPQYTYDNKYKEKIVYEDSRGNINKIIRNGLDKNEIWQNNPYGTMCGSFGEIDNLSFTYQPNSKNRVKNITDASTLPFNPLVKHGFEAKANAADYEYDENGNLKKDDHKSITAIEYNYLNLPTKITFTDNRSIEFIYDAMGKKWRKTVKQTGQYDDIRDYIDGVEFKSVVENNAIVMKADLIHFTEGYAQFDANTISNYSWQGWVYKYALKDHLGNTRVTFSDKDDDGIVSASTTEIEQVNHYYPFGLNMEGPWSGAAGQNKYQYNGKQWNDDFNLGWNDYGARFYDPAMGRWNAVDPLSEKNYTSTPYNYVTNNPMKFIDPDGMQEESTDVRKNKDGTYTVVGGNLNDGDNGIYVKNNNGSRGDLIGYSATPASFYYAEGNNNRGIWQGTINPDDQSARSFLNNLLSENPSVAVYMPQGTNGSKYDFKVTNGTNQRVYTGGTDFINFYRGMQILHGKNGKPIYASARDIGNIGAGLVAGREGMGWATARLGLDSYESYKMETFTREAIGTQYAEKLGHRIGNEMYKKFILSRLPGNAHLKDIKISQDVISKGDL